MILPHTYQNDQKAELQQYILTRMGDNRNSHALLGGIQNGTATLEDFQQFFCKTKHTFTTQSIIILLGIYPKELKTYPHKSLHTDVYTFITAKLGSNPICFS